ncbi:G-protein coupled receptor 182 [Equus przewalskii]|uniref:G protein-coupled receptor 182 n=2 Tax=Equus TaxID=9789 RepID=F6ZGA7_HORSE|nr:PREDICTED: G-protein coupled receptor 182 isoform X1 [Equus przewalskii]XP_008538791.1 PREDICTED: G-protein coupled receptor 182 isoform X1 [Equus przewalskii]XP_023499600.1 G-protein coupled receptor 182 [Equus caballus]XP_023499602.1 G-protein coupled receptor 182 [Equus caballus]
MSVMPSVGPGPSEGFTTAPTSDLEEIHNWNELLHFFNHTLPECEMELDENTKRVVLFVLYLAIFVVGLVENILVICVNWRCSGQAGLLSLYILNMAVADLGIVLSLPVWMLEVTLDYTWLWGNFFCRFTHYFYFTNMYSSIFFLVCLSVDRYVTLTNSSPSWQRHQHKVRRAVCAGVWVLSAIIPLPEVVHIQLVESSEPMCLFLAPFETYSTWALAVALSSTVLGFLLPFPLIAVFNVLMACRLQKAGWPEGRRHCLLVCAYVAVFVICWLPYHVTLLLLTLHGTHVSLHCYLTHLLYFFYDIIDCFSMLHCVVNPILYNFLSPSFRGRLLNAVVHYLPKVQAREGRHASSSSSSTQHSIVITKEDMQPTAAGHPNLNFQAPNTSSIPAPRTLQPAEADSSRLHQ